MSHPYENLPTQRFWRTAVAERSAFQIQGLWTPRFQIKRRTRIMTAGSCFAQHISRALVSRGYQWVDAEPAPEKMSDEAKRDYHYGTFSFRTGNIYTPNMLSQWLTWALGEEEPPKVVWEKDGRFYDPFRPAVELGGFATEEEVYASRSVTIAAVREAVETSAIFVFTLGLTEAWIDREGGFEYAVCPGTLAGTFDPEKHEFVNHGFGDTYKSLKTAIGLARKINKRIRFILTVSPVPLTATASDDHVLTATSHSKSVLRAVAGEMKLVNKNVDYFPSHEMITHPAFRGMFFAPNMRSVDAKGVEFVMDNFFRDQFNTFSKKVIVQGPYGVAEEHVVGPEQAMPKKVVSRAQTAEDAAEEVLCEEEMLDAFAR